MARRIRLGSRQVEALQLWVFDPAHLDFYADHPDEDGPPESLALDGASLVFAERVASDVWRHLMDAANSADAEAEHRRGSPDAVEFRVDRDALAAVARRVVDR
jgi:hypothetical protein